jgi:hypothetical protein
VASSSSRGFSPYSSSILLGGILATEVVGESLARRPPLGELGAAFGDDVIFVLGWVAAG